MQRKRGALLAGLLLAIGLGVGMWLWNAHEHTSSDTELVINGNTDIRQIELSFKGSERITRMLVEEGERAKKGQLLATLDAERLKHAVARSEAQVAAQREGVLRLETGTRPEEIRKARANVEAAAAEAHNAKLTYERLRDLAKKNLAPQQKVDDAKAATDAARARLEAEKEYLNLAVAGPRREDIAAAKATLKVYEAELALAKTDLEDAHLRAPADGVVQERILEPGDMASPQTPVYTLALTTPVWVRAYVEEPDLGRIRQGMKAVVRTDSFPGKDYQAWVGFISPTAEFTPKSVETLQVRTTLVYQVRIYVSNPEEELRLGMPATVIIPLDQALPVEGGPGAGPYEGP